MLLLLFLLFFLSFPPGICFCSCFCSCLSFCHSPQGICFCFLLLLLFLLFFLSFPAGNLLLCPLFNDPGCPILTALFAVRVGDHHCGIPTTPCHPERSASQRSEGSAVAFRRRPALHRVILACPSSRKDETKIAQGETPENARPKLFPCPVGTRRPHPRRQPPADAPAPRHHRATHFPRRRRSNASSKSSHRSGRGKTSSTATTTEGKKAKLTGLLMKNAPPRCHCPKTQLRNSYARLLPLLKANYPQAEICVRHMAEKRVITV